MCSQYEKDRVVCAISFPKCFFLKNNNIKIYGFVQKWYKSLIANMREIRIFILRNTYMANAIFKNKVNFFVYN